MINDRYFFLQQRSNAWSKIYSRIDNSKFSTTWTYFSVPSFKSPCMFELWRVFCIKFSLRNPLSANMEYTPHIRHRWSYWTAVKIIKNFRVTTWNSLQNGIQNSVDLFLRYRVTKSNFQLFFFGKNDQKKALKG